MHLTNRLCSRFVEALSGMVDDPGPYAAMVRPTSDPSFGDYQSNCAMPLAKRLGENPRRIAERIVSRLRVDDFCQPPEIAGPGFINLRLRDAFLADRLRTMLDDPRCGVEATAEPRRVVIDYSSPNVAKPMHVGHIRSTVIGDALARVFRFLGHDVITDNHLGDWGTQFGIIIYAYKHFGDPRLVDADPVPELAKLYRLANRLMDYHKSLRDREQLSARRAELQAALGAAQDAAAEGPDPASAKRRAKELRGLGRQLEAVGQSLAAAEAKIADVECDPPVRELAARHPTIGREVLIETARLHAGDEENLRLWRRFLPHCQDEIGRIYRRLEIRFDHTLGESFYHPMLPDVVQELRDRGLATDSEGAVCVFLPGFEAPMIVRKQDGAFLYATTDLATLEYRRREFAPDEILYVVDSRQSEHFDKLFAVAARLGYEGIRLVHVQFGTVLGEDGRPMKTRSGSLVGLESLLDDAVERARRIVCDPERLARMEPPMTAGEQRAIAEAVGIGAIKYADLAHHRTSDYRFSLDKMIALDGNTATYVQYSFARTEGILRRAGADAPSIAEAVDRQGIVWAHPAERDLARALLRLEETLETVRQDYAPNQLADYLYDTAKAYAVFNDQCSVLKAESEQTRATRLLLVVLCGRVLELGLSLLGIRAVSRM